MLIYPKILDSVAADSKENMAGQMSIFDFMAPEVKKAYEISLPNVPEFDREQLLAFEKDVLGVYLSGHPLEEYQDILNSCTSAVSLEFTLGEDGSEPTIENDSRQVIGGMITGKTIKYTRTNKVMAFVTVEDLVGSVEVLIFPKPFEQYRELLVEDNKVLIEGRVSAEDDRPSKLICEKVTAFSEVAREMWLAFSSRKEWAEKAQEMNELLLSAENGNDAVFVFLRDTKSYREETRGRRIRITEELSELMRKICGAENVKIRAMRKARIS